MTAVEVPLLRRQAYVDAEWVDAKIEESGVGRGDSSDGIDEELELEYRALGGIGTA